MVLSAGREEGGRKGQVTEEHGLKCVGFGVGKPGLRTGRGNLPAV